MIVGQRQRHQLIELQAVLPVQRQQLRRHGGELEPPLHFQHRDAEPRRHVLEALALLDQRLEGVELVGRVQRLAAAVLGDADLERALARHPLAQHLVRGGQAPPGLQQQQRAPPPFTGHDREARLAGPARCARPALASPSAVACQRLGDHQVVQQPLRVDQRRQLLDLTTGVAPHVQRRRDQRRQRHRQQLSALIHDDELLKNRRPF